MPIRPSRQKPKDFERATEVMTKPKAPKYMFLAPTDFPPNSQDKLRPRDIWQGMKEYTTAHGIPHLSRAQGLVKKTFWAVMVTAMLGALTYNMIAISISYFSFNVDVSIKLLHQTELTFPAVTICNMSPVRASAFGAKKRRRKRAAPSYCGANWVDYEDNCYYFSSNKEKFTDAQAECWGLGAELVTIDDAAENTFVAANTVDVDDDEFYIGLQWNGTGWSWASGSDASYRPWQSAPSSSDCCVRMDDGGVWFSSSGGGGHRFTCEKWRVNLTTVEPSTEAETTTVEYTTLETTTESLTTTFEISTEEATTEAPTTAEDTTVRHTSVVTSTTSATSTSADEETTQTTEGQTTSTTTTTIVSTDDISTVPGTTANLTGGSCCCTCCFAAELLGTTCNTCSASSVWAASSCASTLSPPTPTTTPGPVTTTKSTPKTINGSSFPDRAAPREDFAAEEALTEALANMPEAEKIAIGFQPDQMILDCKYAGSECFISQFSQYYNPIHGNCYIFNGGWNGNTTLVKSMKAGRRHGLHLIVNIGQDEYLKQVGDTAGLRLVVHPQNRMPFPEDEGIMVTPGISTSIGLRQLLLMRESSPYGNCTDGTKLNITRNVFEELYPVQYSASACMKTCYQREVINLCGCADPYYPYRGAAFDYKDVRACSTSNLTQDDCKFNVSKRYNRNEIDCTCPDACSDMSYPMALSLGLWPSNVMRDDIAKSVEQKINGAFDVYDPQKIAENLVKLEVYFEEFNFELIAERPAYTPGSYLGDIGGVLGLWVGFSILTIFEFLELAMDIIILGIVRKCQCFKSPPSSGTGNSISPTRSPPGGSSNQTPETSKPCQPKQGLLSGYHSSIQPPSDGKLDQPSTDAPSKEANDTDTLFPPEEIKNRRNAMPPPEYEMNNRGRHRTPPPPYSSGGKHTTRNGAAKANGSIDMLLDI